MLKRNLIFLFLVGTWGLPVFAQVPISENIGFDSASKTNSMKRAATTVHGILNKKLTVGYRSPYFLITGDAQEFEVRESNSVSRDQLEKLVGQNVELTGKQVVVPSRKAPTGSEAESRFVDGVIPQLEYIETVSIRRVQTDRQ